MSYDLPVSSITRHEVLQCSPHTTIMETAKLMGEARCSSILITDKDVVVGIWTERDALNVNFSDPFILSQPVSGIMSSPVMTLHHKTSIGEAAQLFIERGVRHFLVIDDAGMSLGIISQSDVVRNSGVELSIRLRMLKSLLKQAPLIIPSDTSLSEAIQKMCGSRQDAVVVDFGSELGIVTERDVVRMIGSGQIGNSVAEIASRPLICREDHTSLHHVLNLFAEKKLRHLGVTDKKGRFIGLVSYTDMLASIEHDYVDELRQTLKNYEYKLRQADHHLDVAKKIFETAAEAIAITDADTIIQSVNPAFTKITGFTAEEIIGKKTSVLKSGRHGPEFYQKMQDSLKTEGHWQGEIWDKRKNGEIYPKWLSISAVSDAAGIVTNYTATFTDVTEQKRAMELMLESEQRYHRLFHSNDDALFVYPLLPEGEGKFVEVNEVACRRLGYSREELLQLSMRNIDGIRDMGNFPEITGKLLTEKQALFITEHTSKLGEKIPVEVNLRVFEMNGQSYGLASVRDISERKLAEAQIRHLAHYDALTNLPNRRLLLERLNLTLSQAKRYNRQFAILFLDLDGFKQINDTQGHAAGDELLVNIASRLLKCMREGDTVSRLGGDEFIVLLGEIKLLEDVSAIAEKIIHAVKQPIVIGGRNNCITTSVGIAVYPFDGAEADMLIKKADIALYAAKEAGRNGWRFFTHE